MSLTINGTDMLPSSEPGELARPACPICGETTAARLGIWAGEYDRLRCAGCDLIFADPLRGVAGTYTQQYAESGAYRLYVEAAKKVKAGKNALGWPYRILLQRLTAMKLSGTLFEVGCGVGYFPYYLGRRGWNVMGCDIDASAIQSAKSVLNIDVIHSDFNPSTVPDGSLDVLVAFEVIEHLEGPVSFLRLASIKLRKGGYLFLSTPNADTQWPLRFKTQKNSLPPFHLTIFSKRSLRRAAESAGFEVVEFKQKPLPFRSEFTEDGYTGLRLLLEAAKAVLTGVQGMTLFAALRNGCSPPLARPLGPCSQGSLAP